MTSGSLHERITRALAFMLRHQPEDFDLELDRFGWGDLEDVIYALQERLGSSVDEDDVLDAIEASDRPRYEVEDDKIRALYGHSFPIDPGEPTEPPDELFIGVGSRDADRAEEHGLRSGRRAFLHLARTEEEAREAGRRAAKDYSVIVVYAGEAYDEGIDFYDRGSLFLADEVPTEFIEVGEVQHDGIEREPRRSRGRRNNEGPRGSRRGRGRGRGRGRDRYEEDDRSPRTQRDDSDRGPARSRDREERPERDEVPREAPARREPKARSAPAPKEELRREPRQDGDDDGGFGLGLDSAKGRSRGDDERAPRTEAKKPRREARDDSPREEKPRAEKPRAEKPRAEKPRAEKPTPAPAKKDAPGFGFGTGI